MRKREREGNKEKRTSVQSAALFAFGRAWGYSFRGVKRGR